MGEAGDGLGLIPIGLRCPRTGSSQPSGGKT